MKKKFSIVILFICLFILPFGVFAKDGQAVSETLADAAKQEEVAFDHPNFVNSDNKPNIYLFRGHGCGYCKKLITFLETIVEEYGQYFNLVSYEVWYDEDNYNLMKNVASIFNDPATGVPYLVIGDKTFIGYSSSSDENIKNAIKELYEKTDRYNVMDHLSEAKNDDTTKDDGTAANGDTRTYANTSSSSSKTNAYIFIIVAFLLGLTYYVKSNNDKSELLLGVNKLEIEVMQMKNLISEMKNKEKETKEVNRKTTKTKTFKKKTKE